MVIAVIIEKHSYHGSNSSTILAWVSPLAGRSVGQSVA